MKNFVIYTNDPKVLKVALSDLLNYAMFLAEESGFPDRVNYIYEILDENDIEYTEE